MMFLTSWKLALLTCATLPFMLLQFRAFARRSKPAYCHTATSYLACALYLVHALCTCLHLCWHAGLHCLHEQPTSGGALRPSAVDDHMVLHIVGCFRSEQEVCDKPAHCCSGSFSYSTGGAGRHQDSQVFCQGAAHHQHVSTAAPWDSTVVQQALQALRLVQTQTAE